MPRTACLLLSLIFVPLLGLFLLGLNALQMLSLLLLPFSSAAFRLINRLAARLFFDALAFLIVGILRIRVVVTGDALPARENAFVVANHQSMADIPVLVVLASRSGRSGDLKWFVKDVIKWVPGVGWGMLFLDCLFVKRNWSADQEKILATFSRLRDHRVPFWILSFAEGTRLRPGKLLAAQAFQKKSGLPRLENVMSPRTKGFEATLEGLGSLTEAVYDMTIGFENFPVGRVPGLAALFSGRMDQVHVHVRRFPAADLPGNREARVRWILDRFAEKDARLANFRQTGRLA